jgi:hypothetical protein
MPSLNAQMSGESVTTEIKGKSIGELRPPSAESAAKKIKVRVERKSTLFFLTHNHQPPWNRKDR